MRKKMGSYSFLITCEQCGIHIPQAYKYLIAQSGKRVPDAKNENLLKLATLIAKQVKGQRITNELSHLLIDRSKPLHRDEAFSEYSRSLGPLIKKHIVKKYYHPFREKVESFVEDSKQPVFHIIVKALSEPNSAQQGKCVHLSTDKPVDWLEAWQATLSQALRTRVTFSFSHPNKSLFALELSKRFSTAKYHYVELLVEPRWLSSYTPSMAAAVFVNSLKQTINKSPSYQDEIN